MKPLIYILLAIFVLGCSQNGGSKPANRDAAIIGHFHQQLADCNLDPEDLKAIRDDLARRKSPDRQAYLEHLAFADRLLQSRVTSLPASNQKAESYMKALSDEMFTARYLQGQPR